MERSVAVFLMYSNCVYTHYQVLCVAKKHTSGGITAAVIASTSAKPSPTRTFHVTSAHPTHTSQPINEDEGDHDYLPYCDEL